MCGICGKISLSGNVTEELIRKMCGVLTHRGPDDEGMWIAAGVDSRFRGNDRCCNIGLGHRRLAIIDLSPAGHQPMSNEDESMWIVLNGEIYNFIELRETLEKKGHRFKSHTDTEVVLHLYEEKGTECLKDLRGPFAFAIWDSRKERLFIARDRIGKKPIFYTYKNQTLTFASEIKAILQDPEVSAEVNRPAITDYLSYGYTPTPETMFKGIMKLPPAHFMIYEKGNIRLEKYWELDFSKKLKLSEREYCDRTMDMLEECTKIRLISDVPLGAFLSGGIDSSAVVYMMSKLSSKPVKTFSIGFDEESHSELKYASIIAKRFNTEHREYIVRPNAIELLPKLVWHYNEPYADSSALPSYYVAQMTRQEVAVALNGDGGDECFGGYERFMAARYAELINKMPIPFKKKIIEAIIKRIPESLEFKDFKTRLRRFLVMSSKSYKERHYNWMAIFNDHEKNSLFTDEFNKEISGRSSFSYLDKAFNECGSLDIVDKVMCADIKTNLLDDLLVKMDIATMANSLEGRSPFLDHKMMEFCAAMPSNMKIKGTKLKYILKKALSKALPKEILSRGKMGFGVPLDAWFRNELKGYSYDILMSDKAINRGYFKKEAVKKLLDEHVAAKANNGARIWSLLFLELWHREFIDR
ncbi:MAG: asparagine synthase (glutamine-hydrolyzing) [Candidatus Omnitrophica bacterium]|nr:asparagine synthase (glutamine-hydrolyzing) [Candidatus Omnitrophota bacterium]